MDENDCAMNKKNWWNSQCKACKKIHANLWPSCYRLASSWLFALVLSLFVETTTLRSLLYLLLFISRTEACLALSIKDHWMFLCTYWLHKDTNESFKVNEAYEYYSWLSNCMPRSLEEHSIVIFIFSPVIIECFLVIMQRTVLFHLNKGYFAFNGQQKVYQIRHVQ